jgi:hypothetical protein
MHLIFTLIKSHSEAHIQNKVSVGAHEFSNRAQCMFKSWWEQSVWSTGPLGRQCVFLHTSHAAMPPAPWQPAMLSVLAEGLRRSHPALRFQL